MGFTVFSRVLQQKKTPVYMGLGKETQRIVALPVSINVHDKQWITRAIDSGEVSPQYCSEKASVSLGAFISGSGFGQRKQPSQIASKLSVLNGLNIADQVWKAAV